MLYARLCLVLRKGFDGSASQLVSRVVASRRDLAVVFGDAGRLCMPSVATTLADPPRSESPPRNATGAISRAMACRSFGPSAFGSIANVFCGGLFPRSHHGASGGTKPRRKRIGRKWRRVYCFAASENPASWYVGIGVSNGCNVLLFRCFSQNRYRTSIVAVCKVFRYSSCLLCSRPSNAT